MIRQRAPKRAQLQSKTFEEHYGISRLSDRLTTPPEYFWTIKNGYVSKKNYIEQRNGFTKVTTGGALTGSPKIRKLFEVQNATGGKTVIGRGGTRWARLSGGSWVDLDTGRGSDAKGQITQFNNLVLMADGGALRQSTMAWSVSNVSASSPSKVSCVHTHNYRVICNDDDNVMDVYISKVGSLDFSTGSNDAIILSLDQVIHGGDRVIGFSSFLSTFLVIWMERHVVVYNVPTTYDSISLEQVIDVGCVSFDGVISTPEGDLWFPSDSGYKSLKESLGTKKTIDVKDVTALIGPYYRASLKSVTDYQDIVGVFYQRLNHAYFTLPFTSDPEVWAISKDLEAATKGRGNIAGFFSGITAHSFCELRNGDLYFGSDDGHIYKMDYGNDDDGVAIDFEWEKTALYFGDPGIYKAPKEFEALIEATKTFTGTLDYSFGTTGLNSGVISESVSITTQVSLWGDGTVGEDPQWDVSFWDAAGQELYRSRNLVGRGKLMNIRFRHSTINAQVRFPYFIIRYYNEGDN